MALSFLRYALPDGYIHNWLVAGPQSTSVGRQVPSSETTQQAASRGSPLDSGIVDPPVERARFTAAAPDGGTMEWAWRYQRCEDDHLLDVAGSYPPGHALCTWAYAELVSPAARRVRLTLHTFGPAQLWLNDGLALRQDGSTVRLPHGAECDVNLVEGANRVLVRFEQSGGHSVPYALALQVTGAEGDELTIRLPTSSRKAKKHQAIERLADKAYVERDLYAAEQKLIVTWPGGIRSARRLMVRVERPSGHIIGYVERSIGSKTSSSLLEATTAMDGPYRLRIYPEYDEYVMGMRFSRDLDVNLLHSAHAEAPQGSYEERARELLEHAVWWTEGLYSEIARMALGGWSEVQQGAIRGAMEAVARRAEDRYELLVGLEVMAYRYGSHKSFPQPLLPALEECIVGYDHERDEVGAASDQGLDGDLAILRHAGSILAGQLYPERAFAANGRMGRWHREQAEKRAMEWLWRRARGGFAAWHSGEAFQSMLLALVALVDHASSEALAELAAAVTDKLLFTLAANSFKGVFGSAHGATSAASITDGRMEPTSNVSRLLWGLGCWNQHLAAAILLAGPEQYELPEIVGAIAVDRPEEFWARERHVTAWSGTNEAATPCGEVNTVTFKTPDTMLSSAQDYCPGEPGGDEHIWQATLSTEAVVFVSHPGCVNQKQAYRPNFWRGNGVLPRVAQWKDLLIALYRLPDDDWLGYTHAHFPLAAFDQYTLQGGWAFACKGEGYLAITASHGFELVTSGPGAYRELRAAGKQNVWLCQMGRAAQDGSFAEFKSRVLAMNVALDGLQVSCTSLRGDAVTLGWTGPFMVNGVAQPLSGFKHYENPYCVCDLGAAEMEIQHGEWLLRLNLETAGQSQA